MFSRTSLGVAAGAAAVGFIGYCIYFDHKRRSDPLFKQKLRERRKKAKNTTQKSKAGGMSKLPDLSDQQAMQKFFLQEVQLGEELLASGDIDGGVEHLTLAVVVCGQPNQLLSVLQQTLPPQVFHLLEQRIPIVTQQIATYSALEKSLGPVSSGASGLVEEDLE